MTFDGVKSYLQLWELSRAIAKISPSRPSFLLMNLSTNENKISYLSRSDITLAAVSVAALLLTFGVSNADLTYPAKVAVFALIVFVYLFTAGICVRRRKKSEVAAEPENPTTPFDFGIEAKLLALEDANRFFGASLKAADMFRLIASRTKEIVPYAACAVFLVDEENETKADLRLAYAFGEAFKKYTGDGVNVQKGLAVKTWRTRQPQLRGQLLPEENSLVTETARNFSSAMTVPLLKDDTVFGVFVLYGAEKNAFDRNSLQLLEAVGTRAAPLLLSSKAFESSVNNALTDALTNLPNERAFYLVLENQIAEAQRFREERPLTILAMDVKNFDEHNQRFGHGVGDRLLLFAADKIKNQLRQMDLLARSNGDEFLVVLPTASDETAREIVERIERTFVVSPFEATAREKIYLQMSFGTASFGKDGEAAGQLLKHAVQRKQQSKSSASENKILWFPKEYVN